MIAFRVDLNGRRIATAGIPGRAVLHAIVTWVRRLKNPPTGTDTVERLEFSLGGLDSNVAPSDDPRSLSWVNAPMKVGDQLLLVVVDEEQVDPPAHASPTPRKPPTTDRLRSARHYLKLYRAQRVALSKRIRDHERLVASLEGKKKTKRSTRR